MPKEIEQKLKQAAIKRRMNKKQTGAYVYGTLRKLGWRPGHEK